jgi:sugar phosphate isomerase/epimerase
MKIGVSSYSYGQKLREGNDLFWAINKAAEQGFEGIEFTGFGGDDPIALAAELKAAAAAMGLPIVSYTVGANLLDPAAVDGVKVQLDIAAALGAPVLRHDAAGQPKEVAGDDALFDELLPRIADGCRAITEYGASLGIRTCVENHGFFMQHSVRCEKLVKAVDHPNFGWLIDIGNFLCADDDPVAASNRMAPYAVHAHAKDFTVTPADEAGDAAGLRSLANALLVGQAVGEGDVDVPGCIAAMTAGGYDGFLSIEYEGAGDCVEGLATGLANLKTCLGAS